MNNEFINKLENDEKILFHEFSDVSKTSKQYGSSFLINSSTILLDVDVLFSQFFVL